MAFRCVLSRQAALVQTRVRSRLPATPRCRIPVWRGIGVRRQSFVRRAGSEDFGEEESLREQLTTELSLLDQTLEELQNIVASGETGLDDGGQLLSSLVEEIKQEQEAWIQESEEIDQLLAKAAALGSSSAELENLKQRKDNMERKITMLSSLLREREKEIGSLESQLEDVKVMGEMKNAKKRAAQKNQLVAAGTATAEIAATAGSEAEVPQMGASFPFSDRSFSVPVTDTGSENMSTLPSTWSGKFAQFKDIMKENDGMKAPGFVFIFLISTTLQWISHEWATLKEKSRELTNMIELVVSAGIILAMVNLATQATNMS